MARRTKAEAEQTRSLILDTAERVFAAKGVSRTTLADIAQAAGLTRGAIYWHFDNKVDLLEALQARVLLPLEEEFARLAEADDPLEGLRQLCVQDLLELAGNDQKRRVLDVMLHKCEYVDDIGGLCSRVDSHCERLMQQLTRVLEHAAARGQLAIGLAPDTLARVLHGFMLGIISDWLFNPARYDLAAEAERLTSTLFHGWRGTPPA